MLTRYNKHIVTIFLHNGHSRLSVGWTHQLNWKGTAKRTGRVRSVESSVRPSRVASHSHEHFVSGRPNNFRCRVSARAQQWSGTGRHSVVHLSGHQKNLASPFMSSYFSSTVKINIRNKTANVNVKKNFQLKSACNGDTANIIQLKQQKSKRCYYLGARWHYGDVLQK